jgi:hypothetical protein
MKKVLQMKRSGIHWPGADVILEDAEADARIKSGDAIEHNEENRKKVQTLVAGTTQGGVSAERVSLDDLAELERQGFKLAEAGPGQVVPIEHDPKFRDIAANVNPPADNAGATEDARKATPIPVAKTGDLTQARGKKVEQGGTQDRSGS